MCPGSHRKCLRREGSGPRQIGSPPLIDVFIGTEHLNYHVIKHFFALDFVLFKFYLRSPGPPWAAREGSYLAHVRASQVP